MRYDKLKSFIGEQIWGTYFEKTYVDHLLDHHHRRKFVFSRDGRVVRLDEPVCFG